MFFLVDITLESIGLPTMRAGSLTERSNFIRQHPSGVICSAHALELSSPSGASVEVHRQAYLADLFLTQKVFSLVILCGHSFNVLGFTVAIFVNGS